VFSQDHKALIRRCFQQRRKQVGPVLRELIPASAQLWLELLAAEGFSSSVRAEAIPVPVWARLASALPGAA
jgi:16S rRNA (adenine1518-N6/adenine1519-N6)-dimethyltransferase